MDMATFLLLTRIVKALAVGALFAGSVGALWPQSLRDRRRAAYLLAGPAFGVTWIAGFLLAWLTGTSLLRWWILLSLAASATSLLGVLFAVGREGRRSLSSASWVLLPLVLVIAVMVWRPA